MMKILLCFIGYEWNYCNFGGIFDDIDNMYVWNYVLMFMWFMRMDLINLVDLRMLQSWNKYVYVLNSFVKYVDFDGCVVEIGFDWVVYGYLSRVWFLVVEEFGCNLNLMIGLIVMVCFFEVSFDVVMIIVFGLLVFFGVVRMVDEGV